MGPKRPVLSPRSLEESEEQEHIFPLMKSMHKALEILGRALQPGRMTEAPHPELKTAGFTPHHSTQEIFDRLSNLDDISVGQLSGNEGDGFLLEGTAASIDEFERIAPQALWAMVPLKNSVQKRSEPLPGKFLRAGF